MAFRILGPIEAWLGEQRLALGGPRQLALLAYLVLERNRAVSGDALIEALWRSEAAGAATRLDMAIARLRRGLAPLGRDGEQVLQPVNGGFVLSVAPGELDADVFESHVHEGVRLLESGAAAEAAGLLRAALGLWRGPPLAEVAFEDFARGEIRRLAALRIDALEARIDADLRLGAGPLLIPELESLLAQHPTRERLAGLLMQALAAAGRRAHALEVYDRTRSHLIGELGLEPGAALRAVRAQIAEPATGGGADARASRVRSPGVPAAVELPSGLVTMLFTDIEGSTRLLHRLGDMYGRVLGRHYEVLRRVLAEHGGVEVATTGDGMFGAFSSARSALDAAGAITDELARAKWPDGAQIRVRIGVHTGTPRIQAGNYWGEDVHYTARLADAAAGGQVLVSAATSALVPDAELVDLGEHRLKDFALPRRLYQLGADRHPAPRTLDPLRSNLPSSPGPLIGRDTERAELVEMLSRGETRLVTVTGAGGTGKTTLTLAVAEELVDDLEDGAFFVALADLTEADAVAAAIASPLGIRLRVDADHGETLEAALADRKLLLVLDNFEHLLGAAPLIARVLAAAPAVRMLVTSQTPLRVRGESVRALGPLELPAEDTVESVTGSGAGRLLIERAGAASPRFVLDDGNAAPLAALCRALGGLPLAIELAAARLAVVTPEDLLSRLREGIDALGRGPRDLPERQRGLRAALEWTHSLLDDDQATLLRRLGVFAGAPQLERIEQVCGHGLEVLDALAGLVDYSLVTFAGDGGFLLHASVRELARDQLAAHDESDELRRRHGHVYADAAESWGRRFMLDVYGVQAIVVREESDLGEAMAWAAVHDHGCFARLAGGACLPLVLRSRLARWRGAIETALAREAPTVTAQAWLLLAGSIAAWQQAELPLAQSRIASAVAAAEESGDRELAFVIRCCAICNQLFGVPQPDVRDQHAALRAAAAELSNPQYTGVVEAMEPYLLQIEGDDAAAEPLFAALIRSPGRTDFLTRMAAYSWPDTLMTTGRYEQALQGYGIALRVARDAVESQNIAYQLEGITMALSALGRHEEALETAGSAESVRHTAGPIVSGRFKDQFDAAVLRSFASLAPDVSGAAYARGKALSFEAAVSSALRFDSGAVAKRVGER